MNAPSRSLLPIARHGLRSGLGTGWFLARIIVPLSAAVALLQVTGALAAIGRLLAPGMGLFGLPGEAAVPLVAGWFAGVYGGVAAASALPLTYAQLNVLALMVLTAHNLPVEAAIASRSGAVGWRVSALRAVVAAALGAILWQVLRRTPMAHVIAARHFTGQAGGLALSTTVSGDPALSVFLLSWARGMVMLVIKIFVIVVLLTIATDLMRAYGVFDVLARGMRPVMRVLGLSESVTFLWLTGTFLGLSYGSGLIIQEARTPGRFRKGELRDLHISIGIAHSLLEDTVLFAAIGVSPLWVLLPRPLAAAVAVRAGRRFVPDRPVAMMGAPEAPEAAGGASKAAVPGGEEAVGVVPEADELLAGATHD